MKILITKLIVIFASALGSIQNANADLSADLKALFPQIISSHNLSGTPEIEESLNHIRENQFLLEFLPIQTSSANKLVFLPKSGYFAPYYEPKSRELVMGSPEACPSGNLPSFLPSNIHEYAHSIFTPNLYKAFGLTREPTLKEMYNVVRAVLKDRAAELKLRVPIRELSSPFDELFADLYTALVLDRPDAINIMTLECMGGSVFRSFTTPYEVSDWDGGSLKPKSAIHSANYHEILSPVRPILWSTYNDLRSSNIPNPGAHVIQAFFLAMVDIVGELYDSEITYDSWFNISKESLNQKTIDRFKDYVSKRQKSTQIMFEPAAKMIDTKTSVR